MRLSILHIIVCSFYAFFCVSCTRTLPKTPGFDHLFQQGTEDDLYVIDQFRPLDLQSVDGELKESHSGDGEAPPFITEDVNTKVLRVQTAEDGQVAKISSSESGSISIDTDSNISFVNQYYFLDYQPVDANTEEQKLLSYLLGDIEDFKGFPNTTYYIVPQLQDNYLILYRVGKKDTIPYDEKHLAVQMGDWLAAPLVGYALEYCEPKKVLNADYEETNVHRPKCYAVPKDSTAYIRLKEETKTVFKYTSKLDVFPRNFFDGQWYVVSTVVKSSESNIEEVGHQNFENALLVEFTKTTHGLQAVDASGYQLKEEDRLVSFFIPVEWKEYRITRDSNILQDLVEQESERRVDIERPYFKIKFQELLNNESTNGNQERRELKNIFITDDYFSYIVTKKDADGPIQWVKYAFRKAEENSGYREKQWYEEDSSQFFPSFVTQRSHYVDSSVYTEADWGKFYRTTRFDPKSEVITWYFSTETPDKVRQFGRQAVALWNRAFQLAGDGQIQIVLDETVERELGDIRYNIINLIEAQSESNSGVLGFGPSIYNPVTGEIISATANVWVTSIVDSYVDLIRQYIRFHIYPPTWKLSEDLKGVSPFIVEKIKKQCTDVQELIDENENSASSIIDSVINDKQDVQACAWELAKPKLLQVTLHEMGHGFGLRHLFSASADAENYYNNYDEIEELFNGIKIIKDISDGYQEPAKYSSLQDYMAHQYPKLTVPGKHDIDSIRFIYFDEVKLTTGETLKIPYLSDGERKQKSIIEVAREEGKLNQLWKYRVCGGKLPVSDNYAISEFNADDPLCAQYDYGATPKEVVGNFIRDSQNVIMAQTRRYDRIHVSSSNSLLYSLDPGRALLPLLHKWYELLEVFFNETEQTIFHFSSANGEQVKEYRDILQGKYKANPESLFSQYYEIREPIFEYFKRIFFLPFKHCVYMNTNGEYAVWPLETIIRRIEGDYSSDSRLEEREVVSSCESSAVENWAVKEGLDIDEAREVGFIGTHDSYFLDRSAEDTIDEISVFKPVEAQDRQAQSIWKVILDRLLPVLLEPSLRDSIRDEWVYYIESGIDLRAYLQDTDQDIYHRFVSYDIDSQLGILHTRIKRYVDLQKAIFTHTTNNNLRQEIMDDISCQPYTFSEFFQYIKPVFEYLVFRVRDDNTDSSELSLKIPTLIKTNYDVFYKSNRDSEAFNVDNFAQFILNSNHVYKANEKEIICIPKTETTFFAEIFVHFNNNKWCIGNHHDPEENFICPDIKNKEAFNLAVTRFMSSEMEDL